MKRSREPEDNPPTAARSGSVTARDESVSDETGDTSLPAAKVAELDLSDRNPGSTSQICCSLPPHKEPKVFASYDEYETHYRDQHTNRCIQCHKNFPSSHLLSIHIEETHDSFVQARRERGERTYSCFVEGCDRKCSAPQKRKMHLIDKHMYPKNFFFAITREGIDGRRSLLMEPWRRRRRSSTGTASRPGSPQGEGQQSGVAEASLRPAADDHAAKEPQQQEAEKQQEQQQPDQEMEDLSGAMSALQFVPMSVRFGRGRKAGFAKQ